VQKNINEGKVKPGQYFVLKFDFSKVRPNPDITEANETLTKFLNSSLITFYQTYAAYLDRNFADLCQEIDSKEPNISLQRCCESVQGAIEQGGRLSGIEGIYVIVDEYDAFSNHFLELQQTTGEPKIAWEGTAVGSTFKSFWSAVKSMGRDGFVRRVFITGISPLSLSGVGSSFNVLSNVSFDRDLAGLCGLTSSDVEDALKKICNDSVERDLALWEMIEHFNGFHFCNYEKVTTVFNTETCLAHLQRLFQGKTPDENPENSEIPEQFLRAFASSAPAIRDFERAMKLDETGEFESLEYKNFKTQLTLRDFVC
jgi:Predicted AAA-ATPase